MSKGGSGAITGYRYSLTMLMGLCRGPVDELIGINCSDLSAWRGSLSTNADFAIDASELFGGDAREGGLSGTASAFFGDRSQTTIGTHIKDLIGASLGGLRGSMCVVFDGQVCSNNPYPKKWSFRVRRAKKGWDQDDCWYPNEAIIPLESIEGGGIDIMAMNPAHIVYEILTNPIWGRGLPRAILDDESFVSAANVLCREKFGLCLKWARGTDDVGQFTQSVLNHIGATLFMDRETGLMTIKLIRDDYDVTELPTFDYSSGLLQVTEDSTMASDNSHSEVVVQWIEPITNAPRQTRVQNLAGTQAEQTISSLSVSYPGIPTALLAARVAQRDMEAQGSIKRLKLVMDRRGRKIRPGGVFKVSIPDRNIVNMVMRAGKVEEGGPDDIRKVTVTALQDVFHLADTSYVGTFTGAGSGTWAAPDRTAVPITLYRLTEATYYDAVRLLTPTQLAVLTVDVGDAAVMAAQPTAQSTYWELNSAGPGETMTNRGNFSWTSTALLAAPLSYLDTSVAIATGSRMSAVTVPQTGWIEDEIVNVTAYDTTTGVLTITRGCVDTIPTPHNTGARIWFPETGAGTDGREYTNTEVINILLQTRTSTDLLDIASAPGGDVTVVARQGRPYIAGNFQIDGVPWFNARSVVGDIVFTWAHRDRLTQADHVLGHTAGSTGPEAGTSYTILFYDADTNSLIRTASAITGTTFTYDSTMETADGAVANMRTIMFAVRGGLQSMNAYISQFTRRAVGYGNDYGHMYGR